MSLNLDVNFPLSSDFTAVPQLQALGSAAAGSSAPAGVSGAIEIVDGAMKTTIRETDPPTFTGIRSEIIAHTATLGQGFWYTWQFKIEIEDWTENSGRIVLAQIHPEDSIVAAVNIVLLVENLQLLAEIPLNEPPAVSSAVQRSYIGQLKFGHWYSAAIHAKWENSAAGFIEFYIDSIPVYRQWHRGTAYNADAPYLKLGVYDGPHLANFGTKAAYTRNVKVYSGNGGYTALLGEAPGPKHRLSSL